MRRGQAKIFNFVSVALTWSLEFRICLEDHAVLRKQQRIEREVSIL